MAVCKAAFQERCRPLAEQLGGDPIAVQAAHGIVRDLDIENLKDLRAYYAKVGPVVFAYEVRDMRHIGEKIAARITDYAAAEEPVT